MAEPALKRAVEIGTDIQDGIHFGLEEADHHAHPALGSSRIRLLRRNPTSYWQKHINPLRKPEPPTRGQERGSALHTLLFHGEAAFDKKYLRGPEHSQDMTPAEKGAATKAANAKAAAEGKTALIAADYDQIAISRAMIEHNSDLKSVFYNGFPEVSIFWRRDGVQLKARIDYLKIRGVGDLKSAHNKNDLDFEECCRLTINQYRYDMQAALYMEARRLIPQMIADGLVFGAYDKALLKKIAEAKPPLGWQWIFYCMEGPPDVTSYILSPQNPMLTQAKMDVELAISRFAKFSSMFGESQWFIEKHPQELDFNMMPPWFARMSTEEMDEYNEWIRARGK